MVNDRMASKMRSFRFNDAMECDLAFLMEMWGCTATDAMTRALCSSAALERAYKICRSESGIPAAPVLQDDLPTALPVEPVATIQSQTAAEIKNPTPSTPSTEKDTAGSAAPTPGKTKGGNKVRWQLKFFLLEDTFYCSTPKAISGETEQIAIANARKWLAEHGHPDFEPFFPTEKHCKTFRI